MTQSRDGIRRLANWAIARHKIYMNRFIKKMPKPWTIDEILRKYSFCNVYRELDRVTIWIRQNWTVPNAGDPNAFFAMTLARLVNWPDTLEKLGYPTSWSNKVQSRFVTIMNAPGKTYSGAYIVSTNGHAMNKAEYLAQKVLAPLWEARRQLQPVRYETLQSYHTKLMKFDGLGSFIAAQVVADVKNDKKGVLAKASDFSTWAASGPGSRRGLNRVLGHPVDFKIRERDWLSALHDVREVFVEYWEAEFLQSQCPPPDMQDLQNCLCEFDKYERTRLGEGRPRSTYPGG